MKKHLIQNHPNLTAEWFFLVLSLRFRSLLWQTVFILQLNLPNPLLILESRLGILNWVLSLLAFLSHQ